MSELSRGILAGTEPVRRATEGLVNLRAVARRNRQRGNAQIGDSLRELGQTIKDYGSWRDAKKAEDEVRSVDDAYALGMQTGEPEKALVTLGAVRPTTAAAATLRAKRMDEATNAARLRNTARLDEAEKFRQAQRYKDEAKYHDELIQLEKAKVEIEKGKEARLGAAPKTTENIDPLSEPGIAATADRARRVATAEADVKAEHPGELDKPYPEETRALFEAKAGLKPGALRNVTQRAVKDLLDLDPKRNMIAALNLAAKQRDALEHEPPALKEKRKQLARLQGQYDDLVKINSNVKSQAMYPGGEEKLAKDIATAKTAMDTADAEISAGGQPPAAGAPVGTDQPPPPNLPANLLPSWNAWSPEERQKFLEELNK